MYFKCRPSVETEHCIIVKGLTPPGPAADKVTLYMQGSLAPGNYVTLYDKPSMSANEEAKDILYAKLLGQPYKIYNEDAKLVNPKIHFVFKDRKCCLYLEPTESTIVFNSGRIEFEVEAPQYANVGVGPRIGDNFTVNANSRYGDPLYQFGGHNLTPVLNLGSGTPNYPTIKVFDKAGNEVADADISIATTWEAYYVYYRNNSDHATTMFYAQIEIPYTLAWTNSDKIDQTLSPGESVTIRPYASVYNSFTSSSYSTISQDTELECKCFDKDFNEVQCNVVVLKDSDVFKLVNKSSSESISVALVKFKFPWPIIA